MLDRKNPYSAIPQLEKKIDNVETGQEEIGLDYSAFKEQTKQDLLVIDGEIVDTNALIVAEERRAKAEEQRLSDIVDNTIETWSGHDEPTLSNYPANDWVEHSTESEHIGDLYYDLDTGYGYRFLYDDNLNIYKWLEMSDQSAVVALALAQTKRKIWLGATDPLETPSQQGGWVSADKGDLWFTGTVVKVWNGSEWEKSDSYTDNTLAQSVADDLAQNYYDKTDADNLLDAKYDADNPLGFTDDSTANSVADDLSQNYYDKTDADNLLGTETSRASSVEDEITTILAEKDTFRKDGYITLENGVITIQANASSDKLILSSVGLSLQKGGENIAELLNNGTISYLQVDNETIETLRMRSATGVGQLGWVAQSNGHLTLKVV